MERARALDSDKQGVQNLPQILPSMLSPYIASTSGFGFLTHELRILTAMLQDCLRIQLGN